MDAIDSKFTLDENRAPTASDNEILQLLGINARDVHKVLNIFVSIDIHRIFQLTQEIKQNNIR